MIFWQQSKSGRKILRRKFNRLGTEIKMLEDRLANLKQQSEFAQHEKDAREKEFNTLLTEYPDIKFTVDIGR
jgi:chromosome segregation ATPase